MSNIGCFECSNPDKEKKGHMPAGGGRVLTEKRETARGRERKRENVEKHEIGTDSRRDEFTDNIQLIHSSM